MNSQLKQKRIARITYQLEILKHSHMLREDDDIGSKGKGEKVQEERSFSLFNNLTREAAVKMTRTSGIDDDDV